jgi:peptidoglycan/LPS O-acetylase OafA/YrhL
MCYSIYLLHFMIITMTGKVLFRHAAAAPPPSLTLMLRGFVLLAIAITASMLFFALVERPCMDPAWPRKLADRVRRTVENRADQRVSTGVGDA